MTDDLYYDRSEFLEAAAQPEYRSSARYRDDVAAKLRRSLEAGTISTMGEQISQEQRVHTRTAFNTDEGTYGGAVEMPGADPTFAEAAKIGMGTFADMEAVAMAMSAPAYEADPTYRTAVYEKVQRSFRAGTLDADAFKSGQA